MISSQNSNSYSISLPNTLPPPADLGSYARSMHQHTQRQMEKIESAASAANNSARISSRRSQAGSHKNSMNNMSPMNSMNGNGAPTMHNGASGRSCQA